MPSVQPGMRPHDKAVMVPGGWLAAGLNPTDATAFRSAWLSAFGTLPNPFLVGPFRKVRVRGFRMDVHHVTRGEFFTWFREHRSLRHGRLAKCDLDYWNQIEKDTTAESNMPITGVVLSEARAFAWHRGGRLPTEVEWEWALRRSRTSGFLTLDTAGSGSDFLLSVDSSALPKTEDGILGLYGNCAELVEGSFDSNRINCDSSRRGDFGAFVEKLSTSAMVKPLAARFPVLHTACRQMYDEPYHRNSTGKVTSRYSQLGAPGFRCVYER